MDCVSGNLLFQWYLDISRLCEILTRYVKKNMSNFLNRILGTLGPISQPLYFQFSLWWVRYWMVLRLWEGYLTYIFNTTGTVFESHSTMTTWSFEWSLSVPRGWSFTTHVTTRIESGNLRYRIYFVKCSYVYVEIMGPSDLKIRNIWLQVNNRTYENCPCWVGWLADFWSGILEYYGGAKMCQTLR